MQSLLIVFAHLASTEQLEGLISFLSQVPDPSGRPALEYVVTEWCMRHVRIDRHTYRQTNDPFSLIVLFLWSL